MEDVIFVKTIYTSALNSKAFITLLDNDWGANQALTFKCFPIKYNAINQEEEMWSVESIAA